MSWQSLLSTLLQRAELKRTSEQLPPRACPNDGEPLISTPNGGLRCPFDGWKWPENNQEAIR